MGPDLETFSEKTLTEHWLARSETRRQAVYDVDRSEDVLDLRRRGGPDARVGSPGWVGFG